MRRAHVAAKVCAVAAWALLLAFVIASATGSRSGSSPPGSPLPPVSGASPAPRGVFHGWVSPSDARLWLEAPPCGPSDTPASLTLSGRISSARPGGPPEAPPEARPYASRAEPQEVKLEPPGLAARGEAVDRGREVQVLDVAAGISAALASGALSPTAEFTSAQARCRSWEEHGWDVGSVSFSTVDRQLTAGDPLTVFVSREVTRVGAVTLVVLQSGAEPVTVSAVSFAHDDVAADEVLVASGSMEHFPTWSAQAVAWAERRYRGPSTGQPAASELARPGPDDPAPPLTWRRTDDLGIELGPYSTAVLAIGDRTFEPGGPLARAMRGLASRLGLHPAGRFDVLMTFPAIMFTSAGSQVTAGLSQPVYMRLR